MRPLQWESFAPYWNGDQFRRYFHTCHWISASVLLLQRRWVGGRTIMKSTEWSILSNQNPKGIVMAESMITKDEDWTEYRANKFFHSVLSGLHICMLNYSCYHMPVYSDFINNNSFYWYVHLYCIISRQSLRIKQPQRQRHVTNYSVTSQLTRVT